MRPEYTINPERRALYRRQGFWGDATLADYWHQSVRAVPDRTCVVDSQGGRYTYAQLDKKAQRLAGWMRTIGVGRGDVVALNLPGWAEFTIAYVAALKLGAIAMPLLPAWREAELSWALDWCEAKVVFTATAFRKSRPIEMLAKLAQHLPRLSAVVAVEKMAPLAPSLRSQEGVYAFEDVIAGAEPLLTPIPADADEVAAVLFTSGTEGRPKGVMLTHNNILASERAYADRLNLTWRDAFLMPAPLGHATGFLHGVTLPFILGGILLIILIIWLAPAIPVSPLGALLIVIFGFFFSTVSARMVGMIGSSNNPVSGMTIATLLIATMILKATGNVGIEGMIGSMAIASVICICAAIAADTSQDLKTGYLLGATPVKQQIGELIGVIAAGLAIGGVLYLLDSAWGYGGAEVPAPQATLMKMIVEGIMGGNLPWNLVFTGVFLAIALEVLRIPVMPFAIGLYLPIYLNTSIMIGGVVRWFMDSRKNVDAKLKEEQTTRGTLFCAGMIAGEGLVGILLAVFAVFGISTALSIDLGNIGGVVLMIVMIACLLAFSMKKKKN